MPHTDLKVWTDEWDGTPVVAAAGEIDLGTVHSLRTTASDVVRAKPDSVIFDFREVTFIDSSGLGILVAARKVLGPSSVTVISKQQAVLASLQLTGLDRVLTVHGDPSEVRPKVTS